jgi:hypothetical protein
MTEIKGLPTDTLPVLMTRDHRIAHSFGLSLRELLFGHTMLPYGIAFMKPDYREKVLHVLLEGDPAVGVAPSFAQSSTKFAPYLQFCHQCVESDLARFGTAYWHRAHQLPGGALCVHHGVPLRVSMLRASQPGRLVLPDEVEDAQASQVVLPHAIALDLTRLSYAALREKLPVRNWPQYYRSRAAELGFGYDVKILAGGVLAADFHEFYGGQFLGYLGLDFNPLARGSRWPASLLHGSIRNVISLRHILLNVFLNRVKSASKPVQDLFAYPKRKRFDWAVREREVLCMLEALKAQCHEEGRRMSIAELSAHVKSRSYLWSMRKNMPAVAAWMETFKASELSERKTGGRWKGWTRR